MSRYLLFLALVPASLWAGPKQIWIQDGLGRGLEITQVHKEHVIAWSAKDVMAIRLGDGEIMARMPVAGARLEGTLIIGEGWLETTTGKLVQMPERSRRMSRVASREGGAFGMTAAFGTIEGAKTEVRLRDRTGGDLATLTLDSPGQAVASHGDRAYLLSKTHVTCVDASGAVVWKTERDAKSVECRHTTFVAGPGGAVLVDMAMWTFKRADGARGTLSSSGRSPLSIGSSPFGPWGMSSWGGKAANRKDRKFGDFPKTDHERLVDLTKLKLSVELQSTSFFQWHRGGCRASFEVPDKSSTLGKRRMSELVDLTKTPRRRIVPHVWFSNIGQYHYQAEGDGRPQMTFYTFGGKKAATVRVGSSAFVKAYTAQLKEVGRGAKDFDSALKGLAKMTLWANGGVTALGYWWQTPSQVHAATLFGGKRSKLTINIKSTKDRSIQWAVPTPSGMLACDREGNLVLVTN